MYQYGETAGNQRERMSCAPADNLRRVHQKNRRKTIAFAVRSSLKSQFRHGSLCFFPSRLLPSRTRDTQTLALCLDQLCTCHAAVMANVNLIRSFGQWAKILM